ncbi:uncharacterized protein LOC143181129 [Calliopsis andreniformis]|uniref:uncharacterized protein LOC143181129 n=1 Tax=Calliopsis andreniformis TaxID=337506 RepID=UPI003FCEA50E
MIRSKATAALMRLKEIDRKYNIKRNEVTRGQSNVSTESSIEETPRHPQTGSKPPDNNRSEVDKMLKISQFETEAGYKAVSKPKVQVKIPFFQKKEDSTISSKNESPQESSENFSKPHLKTFVADDNSDATDEKGSSSISAESTKTPSNVDFTFKDSIEVKRLDSENPQRNNDESSVTTILSKASGGSEIVSDLVRFVEESTPSKSERKSIANEENIAEPSVSSMTAENDETTIEEVIRISGEKSEIISDSSYVSDKSVLMNQSQSKSSSNKVQKIQYESDTFEEASSSTDSSSSRVEEQKKTSEEDVAQNTIRSGVKQIMITPHKQTEFSVQKIVSDNRDKEIIELVAPKIMQSISECDIELDEDLSNYVRSTENVEEVLPINLLRSSKQTTPTKRPLKKNKKHRKLSNETTEEGQDKETVSVASEHERPMKQKENRGEDSSSTSVRSLEQMHKKKLSDEKDSSSLGKQSNINNVEVESNEVCNEELETISNEKLLTEIPKKSDVTCTLRKLNRDAIDAVSRRYRIQTPRETLNKSRQCKTCGTVVKLPCTEYEGSERIEANENKSSFIENARIVKAPGQDERIKKRNKVKRVSKPSKSKRSSNRAKVEEKQSRFDCRQMYCLRKQAVALRLKQEREDIRNYILELEHTRLEFGPGEISMSSKMTPFKPLEFPKIAAFVKPDLKEMDLKHNDEIAGLQERILAIKQWLKDQYVLYRDYSSLAQTVNAKYIPASLEDAKRTIRELQKATIKTR